MWNDPNHTGQQHGPEVQPTVSVECEEDEDDEFDGIVPGDGAEHNHGRLDSHAIALIPMEQAIRGCGKRIEHSGGRVLNETKRSERKRLVMLFCTR